MIRIDVGERCQAERSPGGAVRRRCLRMMSILLDILAPWAFVNVVVCCIAWLSVSGVERRESDRAAGNAAEHMTIRQSSDGTLHLLALRADLHQPSSAR
jgi:hypothetical protein